MRRTDGRREKRFFIDRFRLRLSDNHHFIQTEGIRLAVFIPINCQVFHISTMGILAIIHPEAISDIGIPATLQTGNPFVRTQTGCHHALRDSHIAHQTPGVVHFVKGIVHLTGQENTGRPLSVLITVYTDRTKIV